MTPTHLKALRKLLFFSVDEAAVYLGASEQRPGGVSGRAWRHWEDGVRPIPADVIQHITSVARWRDARLYVLRKLVADQSRAAGEALTALTWYDTIDDWLSLEGNQVPQWRAEQSAQAQCVAEYSRVRLVTFDRAAYSAWRVGQLDSAELRRQWSQSQALS